jgi:hypothetical protein
MRTYGSGRRVSIITLLEILVLLLHLLFLVFQSRIETVCAVSCIFV